MTVTVTTLPPTAIADSTGTGLDSLVTRLLEDPGLGGRVDGANIRSAAVAAASLNAMIVAAARATGADADGLFTADEVLAMGSWIRADATRSSAFAAAHGTDADGRETGFHLAAGDGATASFQGLSLVDTVMDGLYSIGFAPQGARLSTETGAAGAAVADVASWLTQLWADHSTSGTGLDRLTDFLLADRGLAALPDARHLAGVDAADGLVKLYLQGLGEIGALADGRVSAADVLALNTWLRADAARYATFKALHGDEAGGGRGFHLLEGDGGSAWLFGDRLVDGIADGLFHAGFKVVGGSVQDQSGRADASVVNIASWLDYFLADLSTTGTGLDRLVDAIMADRGLNTWTRAADIIAGAEAANSLNTLIAEGIVTTRVAADGWITDLDVATLDAWMRADPARYARFLELHGNDENGVETGFHKVQGDGGRTEIFGERLVDTVADGIYHIGFGTEDGRLLNEDGNQNAELADVAAWLNGLTLGIRITQGGWGADSLDGTSARDQLRGDGSNDILRGNAGNDLLEGGWGEDSLDGGSGNDRLVGGDGWDSLDGGAGSDTYVVDAGDDGYDLYRDTGPTGTDSIVTQGARAIIRVQGFDASGIERIDTRGSAGGATLLDTWESHRIDLSATSIAGGLAIDGDGGDDTILGNADANTIAGGDGCDDINGGAGNDRLTGGGGRDLFRFTPGSGRDTITDFTIGQDVLDFTATTAHGFGSFQVTQDGANTILAYGTDSVVLLGIRAIDLTFDDIDVTQQDGGAVSPLAEVNAWYAAFQAGPGLAPQGFDRIPALVLADEGLAGRIPMAQIVGGAHASAQILALIKEGLAATGALADQHITVEEVTAVQGWIRSDPNRYYRFVELHGDDRDDGSEWGYHLIQNDGANTPAFGQNLVNTIADGMFHIGFAIENGRFLNEDGTANARVSDVAAWYEYFLADLSTTGSGLDRITDGIMADEGLIRWTPAQQILSGARAADGLNALIHEGLTTLGAAADGWIMPEEVVALNAWVRADAARYARFLELHGDDENGVETGFHQVQGDGGSREYLGRDLINTIADGIYHIGFQILDGRFRNEDGDANASVEEVTTWLNGLYLGTAAIEGGWAGEVLQGTTAKEVIEAGGGHDLVLAGSGNDLILGGDGNDTILGESGNDIIAGGRGWDSLDGGAGIDTYRVEAGGDYDRYHDTGSAGTDVILALGASLDIGVQGFQDTGIERIDTRRATGTVRLLDTWDSNTIDLSAVTILGKLTIDGADGNDTIIGSNQDNTIAGGRGDDLLDGGAGADLLTGGEGWDRFVLRAGGGADTVADFTLGRDLIDLRAAGVKSLAGVTITQQGTSAVVALGTDSLTLLNISAAALTASAFAFAPIITPVAGSAALDAWFAAFTTGPGAAPAGLDRLTSLLLTDPGLVGRLPPTNLQTGAQAADGLVKLYLQGLGEIGALADGRVSAADVLALNTWLRADAARYATFKALHGDEAGGGRGFHLLEGDGGSAWLFGDRLVDGIADGLFHAGFKVVGGSVQDQSGRADASVVNIASWLDYFLADLSTTGTGLDRLVDAIMADRGLNTWTRAADIIAGAEAANSLNTLIAEGIVTTRVAADGWITDLDVATLDAWMRADPARYARFLELHGNDENGVETGFHKVQGDGGRTEIFGERLVDTVADGIYHIGFGTEDGRLLNEDGNQNAELADVAAWLNGLTLGIRITQGGWGADSLDGTSARDQLRGDGSNDILRGNAGNDLLEGGWGEDSLDGGSGNDRLVGGDGWDSLDGGAGSDTYVVDAGDDGYDLYRDTGPTGTDSIVTQGARAIIRVQGFDASGIERIDTRGSAGGATLLDTWESHRIDLSATSIAGGLAIDGDGGDDTILGNADANTIAGGDGCDDINGGAGNDRLTGGGGRDLFRFTPGSGRDTITDFTIGQDVLDFTATTAHGFGSFQVTQDGANTILAYGTDSVVLLGIRAIDLTFDDIDVTQQDGGAVSPLAEVNAWYAAFQAGPGLAPQGFDRIPALVLADEGLAGRIPMAQIVGGAHASAQILALIKEGLAATGALADQHITVEEVTAVQGWIRSDPNRYYRFVELHGDDRDDGSEWGYHLIQNDGANTPAFGQNLVNTIADGMFHIGFAIENGRFLNEDGTANARVSDVAAWYEYFLADLSTTGSGLDRITDGIMADEGLIRWTPAQQILSGARAADGLNALIHEGLTTLGAAADGWIMPEEVVALNAWVRADAARYARFLELHGDDENGVETGFHQVQGDGGSREYLGRDLINTIADGIYHIGFQILDGRFRNEDGDANASVEEVTTWLNGLYLGTAAIEGGWAGEVLQGTTAKEVIEAGGGHDLVLAGSGNDLILGGDGNDTILGESGNDIIAGGRGWDSLDGGAGIDTYRVEAGGDYDRYHDTGSAGTDVILALGASLDIGVQGFQDTGIERIDTRRATGTVRLLDTWDSNTIDLSAVTILGKLTIDGADGNDTIIGSNQDNTIAGGRGDDLLDGGDGSDRYLASGQQGWDSYRDTGTTGTDSILATGDIFIRGFAASGIEVIDTTTATTPVRLLDLWESSTIDLRGVTVLGSLLIDGAEGNDSIYGSAGGDSIRGGSHDDLLDGGDGGDTYLVGGNTTTGFEGYDRYADTGTSGADIIRTAAGTVDIGVRGFSATGIEQIDASAATSARILDNWESSRLDFSGVSFLGAIRIDAADGNDTVFGTAGADSILGGTGNDMINGGAGNDVLSGQSGADTFVFRGGWGQDRITDFNLDQDLIDLKGVSGFGALSVTQVGADALVGLNGQSILLLGITASKLGADDFIFN